LLFHQKKKGGKEKRKEVDESTPAGTHSLKYRCMTSISSKGEKKKKKRKGKKKKKRGEEARSFGFRIMVLPTQTRKRKAFSVLGEKKTKVKE